MSYVMIAMAGAGLLKSQLIDKQKAERDRKLRAEEIRLSPWTKMGPMTDVKEADPMGSALAFGAAGSQIKNGMAQQNLNEKIANRLDQGAPVNINANAGGGGGGGYSPYQFMGGSDNYQWNPDWRKYGGYGG